MRVILVGFHQALCRQLDQQGLEVVSAYCPDAPARDASGDGTGILPFGQLFQQNTGAFDPLLDEAFAADIRDRSYLRFARGLQHDPMRPVQWLGSWLETNNRFESQLQHFHRLIREHRIGAILFRTPPYQGGAVLLHALAEALGLGILIARDTPWPGQFLAASTLAGLQLTQNGPGDAVQIPLTDTPAALPEDAIRPASDLQLRLTGALQAIEATVRAGFLEGLWSKRSHLACLHRLDRTRRQQAMRRLTSRHLTRDIPGAYVFLPLPPASDPLAGPLGGAYADPLVAVEELRRVLPDDITLCLRDHPLQTTWLREPSFFDRIGAIPGLRYLAADCNSAELMRGALAVGAIGDGHGWYALQSGRPVIRFGTPWYAGLPGVFDFAADPQAAVRGALAHRHDGAALQDAVRNRSTSLLAGALADPKDAANVARVLAQTLTRTLQQKAPTA